MAEHVIEIGDAIPCDYEAIAFRTPRRDESFIADDGEMMENTVGDIYPPRLIVRKKEVAKKARPYNAEEMRNLFLRHERIACGTYSLFVAGHDSDDNTVLLSDGEWCDAEELQQWYKRHDGSRCEVVE